MGRSAPGGVGGLIALLRRFRDLNGILLVQTDVPLFEEEIVNVTIRRIAATAAGVLAPLVVLAPVAQATTDSTCSTVVETTRQCQPQYRELFNAPSQIEQPIGFPGLGYGG